jgi:hypothetical protein
MIRTVLRLFLNVLLIVVLLMPIAGCVKLGKPAAGCQLFPAASSEQKVTDNKTEPAAGPGGPQEAGGQPSGQDSTVITQSGGVAVANWIGTWQCGNNKMYLNQSGDAVTGWYDVNNSDIEGKAIGNTLVGTWTNSGVKHSFEFTQAADGKSLNGRSRQGSSGDWLGIWACTRVSNARPPTKPAAGQVQLANWTGTWSCGTWGKLTLTQSGSKVTGTYTYKQGKFEGYATGNTLIGIWSEEPTYKEPDHAGDTQFNMAADGKSFTGNWRYGPTGTWTGTWNGQREDSSNTVPASSN